MAIQSNIKNANAIFSNADDGLRFPLTALNRIVLSNNATNSMYDDTKIASAGVIKRDYVPHDITPLIAVTSEALPVDSELYAIEDKYINISTNTLHTFRSTATSGYFWTPGTFGGASVESQRGQRLYVDMATNRTYHWHNDSFVQVGFNAEDVSSIASTVAASVVAEYEGIHDQLRTYQVITDE